MNDKKTVVVVGASRGLGAATARIVSESGAKLVINARSEDILSPIAEELKRQRGNVRPVVGDIKQPEVCKEIIKQAIASFGRIDSLVNCASDVRPIAKIAESDIQKWTDNWTVNILAATQLAREALPFLRESTGRCVLVSSGLSKSPTPGLGAYCIAKAALNQLIRVIAKEERNITALAFDPGIIDTPMQEIIREDGAIGMPAQTHALFIGYYKKGQLLSPERPARSLAALALYAPLRLSGRYVKWNDWNIKLLMNRKR